MDAMCYTITLCGSLCLCLTIFPPPLLLLRAKTPGDLTSACWGCMTCRGDSHLALAAETKQARSTHQTSCPPSDSSTPLSTSSSPQLRHVCQLRQSRLVLVDCCKRPQRSATAGKLWKRYGCPCNGCTMLNMASLSLLDCATLTVRLRLEVNTVHCNELVSLLPQSKRVQRRGCFKVEASL